MPSGSRIQFHFSTAPGRGVGAMNLPSRSADRVTLAIRDHHEAVNEVHVEFSPAVRTGRVHLVDAALIGRPLREPVEFRDLVERCALFERLPHSWPARDLRLDLATKLELHGIVSSMIGPPSSTTSGHVSPPTFRLRSDPI